MGISSYILTITKHSLLKTLQSFIFSNLIMRPTLALSHTHSRSNVEGDEFHPSPLLVLLPIHLTATSIDRDRLPIVEYATFRSHDEDKEEEEEEENCRCAVCLSRIEGWHNVRELGNCDHAFHADCLDSWIDRGGGTCPVCRAPLVSGHGEEVRNGKDPWRSQRMAYLFGEDCFMEQQ